MFFFSLNFNLETPLCLATTLRPSSNPTKSTSASSGPTLMIMALVNGGALVDFRDKDGATAMHRAVARNNVKAMKDLLDLGASPNYKVSYYSF